MIDTPVGQQRFQNSQILYFKIGEAIMMWATVELNLTMVFITIFGQDTATADMLWGRIRSFEAKLQMLGDLARKKTSGQHRNDWILLQDKAATLYRKRNEVAHSTMVFAVNGSDAWLEPFLTILGTNKKKLTASDLDAYSGEFQELSITIDDFIAALGGASPLQGYQGPRGDLLPRLRTQAVLKREEQRHRALAWRQYLQSNPTLKF